MSTLQKPVKAKLLDVGKPLRFLVKDEKHQNLASTRINSLDGGDNRPNVILQSIRRALQKNTGNEQS